MRVPQSTNDAGPAPRVTNGPTSANGLATKNDATKNHHSMESLKGTLVKVVLLGLVDAFAVFVLITLFLSQS